MKIDYPYFFRTVRNMADNHLTQTQVDGFNLILQHDFVLTLERTHHFPKAQLSYILATAWWETNRTMQPIEEIGHGRGRTYGEVDKETGQTYYGRGFVQLTWRKNYERASALMGVDFVNSPDLVMLHQHASTILFRGMTEGWFTGKRLSDYITSDLVDFYNARRIINGTDKAGTIAGLAATFREALG